MTIPFSYIARNLAARRLTTALTAGGMALVVYVFATVLMLAAGLEQTLVSTGQDDNVVVIRRAAQTEVQSGVDRVQAGIVESLPDIAIGARRAEARVEGAGRPHQPAEARLEQAVERRHPRRHAGGLALRPQVKLVEGRMFRPGTAEVIAGRVDRRRLPGRGRRRDAALRLARLDGRRRVRRGPHRLRLGDLGRRRADAAGVSPPRASRRSIFRLADSGRFDAVKREIESDPRLTLEAKRETRFYADQSEALSKFISYLGTTISVIFSIGAIIGAMITMYASVASRTAEIGTLRALGFSRAVDPRRVPRRGAAAGRDRRRRRPRRRVVHAGDRRSRRRTSRRSPSSRSRSR